MNKNTIIFSIIAFVSIFLLWFFADSIIQWRFGSFGIKRTYGDIFNALSSLFTALAFAGLIVTILIQRQDINNQNKISNTQNKINNIRTFEDNFFRLLEQHHRIIDSFVIDTRTFKDDDLIRLFPDDNEKITKLNAFDYLARSFKKKFEDVKKIRFHVDNSFDNIFVHSFLHDTYKKYGYMLGHYYRNLYHIIKFIDEDKSLETFEEKYKYIKILRAQLSAPEINLLAWNGLTYHGESFKPLIEKYKLLKNMNFDYEMVNIKWLAEKYPHIKKEVRRENPIFEFETEIGL